MPIDPHGPQRASQFRPRPPHEPSREPARELQRVGESVGVSERLPPVNSSLQRQKSVSWWWMCLVSPLLLVPAAGTAAGNASVTDTYANQSLINAGGSSNYAVNGGALKLATSVDVGNGADGACLVSSGTVTLSTASCAGRTTPDAPNFLSTTNTAAGDIQLILSSTPTGLNVNDEVLIINLQGTPTLNSTVGKFETKRISAISGNTLTFSTELANQYDGAVQKVMVQRIPNYTSVTVASGATLTALAWNQAKGGVLAFRATGAVSVAGSISMSGKGYGGGLDHDTSPWNYGQQGESVAGAGPQSSQSSSVFAANFGGGGGSDPGNCGPVWPLSAGGGSYGTQGTTGSTSGCGTSPSPSNIAQRGSTYGVADLSLLHLGSGGGAGGSDIGLDGSDCHTGSPGGAGGGIIYINAASLTVTGSIVSNGANGIQDRASGGAGSGGAIRLSAGTLSLGSSLVSAVGGTSSSDPYCPVTSGVGGNGRIAIYSGGTTTGTTNPTANSAQLPSFATTGTVSSVNLLSGLSPVDTISGFSYSLSSLPSNTTASIQFSQDGSSWYGSSGVLGASDTLSIGTNTPISLSTLGWSGAQFYYRVSFTSNGTASPVLDDITVTYCGDTLNTDGDSLGNACDDDDDNDAVLDPSDNCPLAANTSQGDLDQDSQGDACDDDDDGDTISDGEDNCSTLPNTDQVNTDNDAQGDICDTDDDDDGWLDTVDNCPFDVNIDQEDTDLDGLGNECDADDDDDDIDDSGDNCPLDANPDQADLEEDGIGDVCDPDDDGDGFADLSDNCPTLPNNDQLNTDGDGQGDACDADDDNDGTSDSLDNCPLTSNPDQLDTDGDTSGDLCDSDDDNDNISDLFDNCPLIANNDQVNTDSDGQGDVCDNDDDNDAATDSIDNCPLLSNPDQLDLDSDGAGDACDTDADGDGATVSEDCNDLDDSLITLILYFADADNDTYGDLNDTIQVCQNDPPEGYVRDNTDNCPSVSNVEQTDTDADGAGNACDEDDDDDTVLDANDNCPLASNPDQADTDGNGTGNVCEDDVDGDGISDQTDNCLEVPNVEQTDGDQDDVGDVCDACAADPNNDQDADGVCGDVDNCPDISNDDQADEDQNGIGDACDVSPTATPSPTETPAPTATPNPTESPEPTQVPTPDGTATPDITATPDVTATPIPTATPEVTDTPADSPADSPGVEPTTPGGDAAGGCSCSQGLQTSHSPVGIALFFAGVTAFMIRRRRASQR